MLESRHLLDPEEKEGTAKGKVSPDRWMAQFGTKSEPEGPPGGARPSLQTDSLRVLHLIS